MYWNRRLRRIPLLSLELLLPSLFSNRIVGVIISNVKLINYLRILNLHNQCVHQKYDVPLSLIHSNVLRPC